MQNDTVQKLFNNLKEDERNALKKLLVAANRNKQDDLTNKVTKLQEENKVLFEVLKTSLKNKDVDPNIGAFIDLEVIQATPDNYKCANFYGSNGLTAFIFTFENSKYFSYTICDKEDSFIRAVGFNNCLKAVQEGYIYSINDFFQKDFDEYVEQQSAYLKYNPSLYSYHSLFVKNLLCSHNKFTDDEYKPVLNKAILAQLNQKEKLYLAGIKKQFEKMIPDVSQDTQFIQLRLVKTKDKFLATATKSFLERHKDDFEILPTGGATIYVHALHLAEQTKVVISISSCSLSDNFSYQIGRMNSLENSIKNKYEVLEFDKVLDRSEVFTEVINFFVKLSGTVVYYK